MGEILVYNNLKNQNINVLSKEDVIENNILYFKSGIGDNLDLKVDIQSAQDYYEPFSLYADIYGTYVKNIKLPAQVNFDYKVRATGTYTEEEREGFFKFKISAYPVNKLKFTVKKTAIKPVKVSFYVETKVGYYKDTEIKNGDVEIYEPAVKTFKGSVKEFNFTGPIDEAGKIRIPNTTTVLDEVKTLIDNDAEIQKSISLNLGYFIFYYEIFSDYSFDSVDIYDHTKPKTWTLGSFGNVKVVGDRTDKGYLNPNSFIYIYGTHDGQLYEASSTIEKTFTLKTTDIVTLISSNDLVLNKKLKNISSELLDETDPAVVTEVTIDYLDSDITITSALNPLVSIVLAGKCTVKYQSINDMALTYRFNESFPQTDIMFTNIFDASFSNPNKKYFVEITVLDATSNIYILDNNGTYANVVANLVLEYPEEDIYSKILLESRYITVTKEYESIYPNDSSWKGTVNGKAQNNYFDFTLPYINLPTNLTNVAFEALITNIYPEDASVKTEFKATSKTNKSSINADTVTFSSDYTSLNTSTVDEFITSYKFESLYISHKESEEKTIIIDKPSGSYSSFKVKLRNTNSNVRLSDYNETLSFVNNKATVSFKAIYDESLISSLRPRVHNGFYYINQHEYFLYSKDKGIASYILDTNKKIKTGLSKYNIYVDFNQNLSNTPKNKAISSYGDFLDDEEHISNFDYDTKQIFVKPSVDDKYYKAYPSEADYISNTIFLGNNVTSLSTVNFTKNTVAEVDASFYIQYFDESTLAWSSWILKNSGSGLSDLKPSSFIRFKINLKNQIVYNPTQINETYSCCLDFEDDINPSESNNIKIYQNRIEPINSGASTVFISKVYDYSTEVSYSMSMNASAGASLYVASSNDKNNLNNFVLSIGQSFTGRYVRYKIVLNNNQKVYQIFKMINTYSIGTLNLAKLGDISISYNISEELKTINKNIIKQIPFDASTYTLSSNLLNDIKSEIYALGFTESNVKTVRITNNNTAETTITAGSTITTSIDVKSNAIYYEDSSLTDFITVTNNALEISPIPQQFSPIIIEDEAGSIFSHVPFLDDDNNPILENKENIISNGQKIFVLAYTNIKPSSLKVYDGETLLSSSLYSVDDNIITFNSDIEKGKELSFEYSIDNSFIVLIDEAQDKAIITLNPKSAITKAKVYYETNKISSQKYIDYLSFNTIYNPQNEGFIYLDYNDNTPNEIKIHANPLKIKADNKDILRFYAEVLDINKNFSINKTVIASALKGTVTLDNNLTDSYGIISGTYKTAFTGEDTLTISCNSVVKTIKIIGI